MILHYYFARRFLRMFLGVLAIFFLFVSLLDLVDQLRRFDASVSFARVLQLTLLNTPQALYQMLPLVMILSSIALFLGLSRSSELVVSRASGRSGLATIVAPALVAALIGALAVGMGNPIVAATSKRFSDLSERYDSGGSNVLSLGAEGLWLRQGDASGQTVIRAARTNPEATALYDVSFVSYGPGGGPVRRIEADEARLEPGVWVLENAKIWPLDSGVNPETASRREPELLLAPSTLTQENIRDRFGNPAAVPIWELPVFIANLEQAGFSARRHQVWLQMELARPLFLVALVMVGAGLHDAPQPPRADRNFGARGDHARVRPLLHSKLRPDPGRERPDSGDPGSLGAAGGGASAGAGSDPAHGGWLMPARPIRALAPAMAALCLLLALAALAVSVPARAQEEAADAALLVADQVLVENQSRLIATGNVEALYDGTRLNATRIVYDRDSDTLTLDGPLRITDPQGNVLVADSGRIDSEMRNGLLRGARIVLDQQLQMASVEARRVAGRYTQLSRVAVTSCRVCGDDTPPLWQIRASRVVHDQEERQIYFENAQLRVLDVPVFYVPYMRLPDPTLERARGFLIPSIKSSTLLGFGVKLPYFIPLGATPRHHAGALRLAGDPDARVALQAGIPLRRHRAERRGHRRHSAARTSAAAICSPPARSTLPRDFRLGFDIEATTDDAYLNDYDYSGTDRLESDGDQPLRGATRLSRGRLRALRVAARGGEQRDAALVWSPRCNTNAASFPGSAANCASGAELHNHFRYSDLAFDVR